MNWMEQHGTDGRGARRGRPGHAGSCSFPPSGAGTVSGKKGDAPPGLCLPLAGKAPGGLGVAVREFSGAAVERRRFAAPRVPGLFLMVMRAGPGRSGRVAAASFLLPARDRGVHRPRPPGQRPWSRQSPRPLRWEEQVSELRGGREGALGWGRDPWQRMWAPISQVSHPLLQPPFRDLRGRGLGEKGRGSDEDDEGPSIS